MKKSIIGVAVLTLTLILLIFAVFVQPHEQHKPTDGSTEPDMSTLDIPAALLALSEKNPETSDFVSAYYKNFNKDFEIDLSSCCNTEDVPLLMQWDERWGYSQYAGEFFACNGCGPTCLSMVCLYLLDDPQYTPRYIADFAESHGFYEPNCGSTWTLISEGGTQLGLDVTEIPLDKQRIIDNLEVGNPIICVVGEGDFTSTGHFIVLTSYSNGKLQVNDPNSRIRSDTEWELDRVMPQIKNLWVCRGNIER